MDLTHLDHLESESIFIIREVVSEANNPVMLYSIGKDSSVMLHLALKAFYPNKPPFPLLHIDTLWKFREMYYFRDSIAEKTGMKLMIHTNDEGVKKNINPIDYDSDIYTDIMKTQALKQALDLYKFDIAFGGGRRDEEKSRSKERILSIRNSSHSWDPRNQRPELWNLFNCMLNKHETMRAFPLSNWTELDVWHYIHRENINIVPLYFSSVRPVINRDGLLLALDDKRLKIYSDEKVLNKKVRFRTLGCYPLTGAFESDADSIDKILLELNQIRNSERHGRAIDASPSASMEKKKKDGYF